LNPNLAEELNAALPQTQCTRCGYPDCRSYAQAIANGEANINQCPPGGAQGVAALAAIVQRPVIALNPHHGNEGPRAVAAIDEAACIGCTLCLDACPVDSILGGPKQMHTVMQALCTGCALCISPCPVDCITLHNVSGVHTGWSAWSPAQALQASERYSAHQARRARTEQETNARLNRAQTAPSGAQTRQAAIAAAIAKAKTKRTPPG
jgi:Na+-translocating ferredoxin:NAD+ oxidoreductase subunit B